MTTTRIEKAARLISQGKVRPIQARSFVIEGDSGTYLVTITQEPPGGNVPDNVCNCRYSRSAPHIADDCAYVEAARAMMLMEEREGWTKAQTVSQTVRADNWAERGHGTEGAARADVRVGVSADRRGFDVRSVSDGALLDTFQAKGTLGTWFAHQVQQHGVIELICNPDGRERTDG